MDYWKPLWKFSFIIHLKYIKYATTKVTPQNNSNFTAIWIVSLVWVQEIIYVCLGSTDCIISVGLTDSITCFGSTDCIICLGLKDCITILCTRNCITRSSSTNCIPSVGSTYCNKGCIILVQATTFCVQNPEIYWWVFHLHHLLKYMRKQPSMYCNVYGIVG